MKDTLTKVTDFLKNHKTAVAIAGFCIVAIIVMLIAVFALYEFIVSVCILIVLEAAMAALLHKEEIWKHGLLLAAQFVAALVLQRVPLVLLCIIVYVAATATLHFMNRKV